MAHRLIKRYAGSYQNAKLLVLNYHNIVSDDESKTRPGTAFNDFKKQITWLQRYFDILPLKEAINNCRQAVLKKPTICITFDDGYKTQKTLAADFLLENGIPATFFVSSGHLDEKILWNDWYQAFRNYATAENLLDLKNLVIKKRQSKYANVTLDVAQSFEKHIKYLSIENRKPVIQFMRSHIPAEKVTHRMMSKDDIVDLDKSGFEIGSHCMDHPILTMESNSTASHQITCDIKNISNILGKRVDCFAIPNGKPNIDYNDQHLLTLSRSQVKIALTSDLGYFSPGFDPLQIARVGLRGQSELGYIRSLRLAYSSNVEIVNSRGYENRT